MRALLAAAFVGLVGCSANASQSDADYEVQCEGVGLHLNGISGAVSDITALPKQRYRVSPGGRAVSRILADGQPDKLCLAGAKCTADFTGDRVRVSWTREDATSDFFLDRRSGAAYYVLRVPLATGKLNISSWQMSCAENAATRP